MGQKTHPIGFRLGFSEAWRSNWFSDKNYKDYALMDCKLRDFLKKRLARAGLARVDIERSFNEIKVRVHVARPGVVIGRGGSGIEMLKHEVRELVGSPPDLEVVEVRQPDLSAELVAQNIVYQLERRRPFRRVITFTLEKVMTAGAKGVKITCKGLIGGRIARATTLSQGTIPLQTLKSAIDYAHATARGQKGTIGVKVWIYKGEDLGEVKSQ